jgi:hypothetical protein
MMAARGSGNEIHFQVKLGFFVGLSSAEFIVRKRVSFFIFLKNNWVSGGEYYLIKRPGFDISSFPAAAMEYMMPK